MNHRIVSFNMRKSKGTNNEEKAKIKGKRFGF